MRSSTYCLLLLVVLTGCGAGSPKVVNPLVVVAVTLSPNTAQTAVAGGTSLALSATLSNDTSNQGVSWSLSPASGCGILSAASGPAVNYTPPASLAQPCAASITVASVADWTRKA